MSTSSSHEYPQREMTGEGKKKERDRVGKRGRRSPERVKKWFESLLSGPKPRQSLVKGERLVRSDKNPAV